jgi:predicted ester cyclase
MAEQDKTRIQEFIDRVFNQHDVDAAGEYMAADVVDHNPWPGSPATLQGFKDGTKAFFAGFPDAHIEIDEILSDGDKLVIRSRLIGTNSGPFMGMPPTGKRAEVEGIDIVRMVDGLQVEHWGIFDAAAMLQQLGVIPAPTGAPA